MCKMAHFGNCDPETAHQEYCIFHKPNKSEEEAKEFYRKFLERFKPRVEEIEVDGKRIKRFVFEKELDCRGFVFPEIPEECIFYKDEDGNEWNEKFSFEYVVFKDTVDFSFSKLYGIKFNHAEFRRNVSFVEARFENCEFYNTYFLKDTEFHRAKFDGLINSFKEAVFEGNVKFGGTIFTSGLIFDNAQFYKRVSFKNVNFLGKVYFRGVTFHEEVDFSESTFSNITWFDFAEFKKDVRFTSSKFRPQDNSEINISKEFLPVRFVGVKFSTAWFNQVEFYFPVDFSFAIFNGITNFGNVRIREKVLFHGTKFNNFVTFSDYSGEKTLIANPQFVNTEFKKGAEFKDGVIFVGEIIFAESIFRGTVSFKRAEFKGDVIFSNVRFFKFDDESSGDVDFSEAVFHNRAIFGRCSYYRQFEELHVNLHEVKPSTFYVPVSFQDTHFKEEAIFRETKFNEHVQFTVKSFDKKTYFSYAEFNKGVDFSNVSFKGRITFEHAIFSGNPDGDRAKFEGAEFQDVVTFFKAQFRVPANFYKARFKGTVNTFSGITFGGDAQFSEVIFAHGVSFQGSIFEGTAQFIGTKFSETDFTSATFTNLVTFYDAVFKGDAIFKGVTFERIAIFTGKPKEEKHKFYADLDFSNCDIYKGIEIDIPDKWFKLPKARAEARRIQKISYERLGLYDKADEMLVKYKRALREEKHRVIAFFEWLILDLPSNYLTNPRRILCTSVAIILIFAILYWIGGYYSEYCFKIGERSFRSYMLSNGNICVGTIQKPSTGQPIKDLLNSLYYSIVTFTTLGYGDINPTGLMKAISSVEALLGALLIATLVSVGVQKITR
ncbi:MAG: pentapeptide repeat-containing protein [Thermococcus sp.]|uniref:pentapeptide repeat-containing protein n=1 Tax=Thermococcus sp. TaxID=35749 RepID=UPI001D1E5B95|nr:pentapeptide repeat-containing protein [Thermococcus sp.]MBO8174515.1 pentapeptide repeat-containing protein [Thermococcus sp.]